MDFEIQIAKYWSMALNCEASGGGVESAPGSVDNVLPLGGVGGLSGGEFRGGIDVIDAIEGEGDKTAELVLE